MRERVARKLRSNPQLVLFLSQSSRCILTQRRAPGLLCLPRLAECLGLPAGAMIRPLLKVEDSPELPDGWWLEALANPERSGSAAVPHEPRSDGVCRCSATGLPWCTSRAPWARARSRR